MAKKIKIAELVAEANLDNSKFKRELGELRRDVDRKTDMMVREFKKVERKGSGAFRRLGAVAISALSGIAVFFAARGIFRGFSKMISLASDTTESMNKVKQVFGTAAAPVISFSNKAATALGATRQEALAMTGEIGNLLVAMGGTGAESAKMSTEIVRLAADLGSFNNVPTVEALNAIRSALVGEVEPMRRFGSDVRVARIEAIAAAEGIDKSALATDQLLAAQLRLKAIFQDTKKAQGDFLRTNEDWANLLKTINALVKDAAAKLGTALIPQLTEMAKQVKGFLSSTSFDKFLDGLVRRFGQLAGAIGKAVDIFLEWVNAANTETVGDRLHSINDELKELNAQRAKFQGTGVLSEQDAKNADLVEKKIKSLSAQFKTLITDVTAGKRAMDELFEPPKKRSGGIALTPSDRTQAKPKALRDPVKQTQQLGTEASKAASAASSISTEMGKVGTSANQAAGAMGRFVANIRDGQFSLGSLLSLVALLPGVGPGVGAAGSFFGAVGFKSGGTATVGQSGIARGATGLSGMVPAGFPNDNFLVGVTSGERVNVETRGQASANDRGQQAVLKSLSILNLNVTKLGLRQDSIEANVNIDGSGIQLLVEKAQQRERRFS